MYTINSSQFMLLAYITGIVWVLIRCVCAYINVAGVDVVLTVIQLRQWLEHNAVIII